MRNRHTHNKICLIIVQMCPLLLLFKTTEYQAIYPNMNTVDIRVMGVEYPKVMCVVNLEDDEIKCIKKNINVPVFIDDCEFRLMSVHDSYRSEEVNSCLLSKIITKLLQSENNMNHQCFNQVL